MTYQEREIERQKLLISNAYFVGKIPYWKSNDRVPPKEIVATWGLPAEDIALIDAKRDEQTSEFLAAYRLARAEMTPEQKAEELAEMRAELGTGSRMVNVITGETFKL